MKINFIFPGHWRVPIGGLRVVYEYANHLVEDGNEVTVVHVAFMPNYPRPYNSFYSKMRNFARYLIDTVFKIEDIMWQPLNPKVKLIYVPGPDSRYIPDADAVIATAWYTAEYVINYPSRKGEKFYLIQHYEIWDGLKERVESTWKSDLHKIVISKWLWDLGKRLGITDMVYIPNGINHKIFRLVKPIEARSRKISMFFSCTEWKGSRDGLQALRVVKKYCPDISVVLFGACRWVDSIPEWMRYIRNPPLDSLVNEIYNNSSIFLVPSWSEGWGLPGAEAMACGCALVSTDNGGVRDYAVDGENALLSTPRCYQLLAENMMVLLNNDELRVSLANKGREDIFDFTWEQSTAQLEGYLNKHIRDKTI